MEENRQTGIISRLLGYVAGRHKKAFAVVVASVVISVAAGVIGNIFMQVIIDNYLIRMIRTGEDLFGGLIFTICMMGAVFLLGTIGTLIYTRGMAIIAQRVLKEIRDDVFVKMQKLPISFFDTHTHGDIMSVYTNDTDTLRQFLAQSLPMVISSGITLIASFVIMLHYNIWLTLIVLAVSAVMVLVSRKMVSFSGRYFRKQQDSVGMLNGYIEEMLGGQKVIKVFCHEKEVKEEFYRLNDELFHNASVAGGTAIDIMPVLMGLGNLQYLLIAVAGGAMAVYGSGTFSMTIGMLIAFLAVGRQFTNSITQASQQFNSVVLGLAGAGRIFALMDQPEEEDHGYVTLVRALEKDGKYVETEDPKGVLVWRHPHHDDTLTYTKVAGHVVFDHVDFSYDGRKLVLQDISLYAKPNQKIAFVGATGAGKTTITNLINRFYDLADGKIRYDGININKIRKPDLRRSMSVILQDVNLFSGTIMDNIRYGKLDASDDECIQAAKLAGVHDFIERLPKGYQTQLEDGGANLSQGQLQLLSIARAAVADPPVMIMDEATSSVDTRTEKIVQDGMDRLMDGRTVFVIAHRLSTVRNANAIMVLELGKIIERGTHEQLLQEKGQYYQLYTGAFELE